jgi:carbon storage regulator
MLVLTRKVGAKVVIGSNVTLTVLETQGGRVRLGIEAPAEVAVLRSELYCEKLGATADAKGSPSVRPRAGG